VTRDEKRMRLALEECDTLIDAALLDLTLMRIGLECVRGEVRDALHPPDGRPMAVVRVTERRRP
jgi:hypothetical protein